MPSPNQNSHPFLEYVKKRDGRLVPFERNKILEAISKAAHVAGQEDLHLIETLVSAVESHLKTQFTHHHPSIEDIQDAVEQVLMTTGCVHTAKTYILYREQRSEVRKSLQVMHTQVNSHPNASHSTWDKNIIRQDIVNKLHIPEHIADGIASRVERSILGLPYERISTTLIRELVHHELNLRGFNERLHINTNLGPSVSSLEQLLTEQTSLSTHHLAKDIAQQTMHEYLQKHIYSTHTLKALKDKSIYFDSQDNCFLYQSVLNIEQLKLNHATPHTHILCSHIGSSIRQMSEYTSHTIALHHLNILLAPFVEGMSYEQMKQEASHLFDQTNSLSELHIHLSIPHALSTKDAIGPLGESTGKTYADYRDVSEIFALALMDAWNDSTRLNIHMTSQSFKNEALGELSSTALTLAKSSPAITIVLHKQEQSLQTWTIQSKTINLAQVIFRVQHLQEGNLYLILSQVMDSVLQAIQERLVLFHHIQESIPENAVSQISIYGLQQALYALHPKDNEDIRIKSAEKIIQYIQEKTLHFQNKYANKISLKLLSDLDLCDQLNQANQDQYSEWLDTIPPQSEQKLFKRILKPKHKWNANSFQSWFQLFEEKKISVQWPFYGPHELWSVQDLIPALRQSFYTAPFTEESLFDHVF